MPDITLVGHKCTGHGSYPPRPSIEGSSKVKFGGKAVVCVGDKYDVHCNSNNSCHDGALAKGSSKVRIEGRAVGRVGDPIDCGSTVAEGYSKVRVGG